MTYIRHRFRSIAPFSRITLGGFFQVLAAYEEMLRVQEEEKAKALLVDPEVRNK